MKLVTLSPLALALVLAACVSDSTPVGVDAGPDVSVTDSSSDVAADAAAEAGSDAQADVVTAPLPATLAGVVVWLDAQAASSLTVSGGKVTKWADRSAFQHDAVAESGYEPSMTTDAKTGLPLVAFSSAMMHLSGSASDPSLQLGDLGDFYLAMVMRNTNGDAIIFHDMDTATPQNGVNVAIVSGEQQVRFMLGYSPSGWAKDSTSTLDGKLRQFGFERTSSGAELDVRDDATQTGTATVTPTNVTTGAPFRLGGFSTYNAQQFMTGAIGELVLVKGALSPADRASLESYLAAKWQL